MIEPEYYKFPHKQESKKEPTKEQKRKAADTLAYLESLPFRPHGMEW